jgi:hypothetical protein
MRRKLLKIAEQEIGGFKQGSHRRQIEADITFPEIYSEEKWKCTLFRDQRNANIMTLF